MKSVHLPALGVGQSEGTLLGWLKAVGDPVSRGEAIAEIETDKSTMDLESPCDGWLARQLVDAGGVVPVGTVLGEIREAGDEPIGPTLASTVEAGRTASATVITNEGTAGSADEPLSGERQPHLTSPRQRRLQAERAQEIAASVAREGEWTRGRHRDSISRQVSEAWREIPHFAVVREVRAAGLSVALEELRRTEPRATYTDLLLAALSEALRSSGLRGPVPLGLAVATDNGVVVPIVADTSGGAQQIVGQRLAAIERARSGRGSADDAAPGVSATLSNLGALGVDAFTGVIATGQTLLLTVGRIALRPVVSGDGSVEAAETFVATLNVDHRAMDGDGAARLIGWFAEACERVTTA